MGLPMAAISRRWRFLLPVRNSSISTMSGSPPTSGRAATWTSCAVSLESVPWGGNTMARQPQRRSPGFVLTPAHDLKLCLGHFLFQSCRLGGRRSWCERG
jgi:hypothetical protein